MKGDLDLFPMSLGKLNKQIQRRFSDALGTEHINNTQAMYLLVLSENDGLSLKELTEDVGMDKALTTRIIRCFKEEGYIYTDRTKAGERKYKVYLTDVGKETVITIRSAMMKIMGDIFSILTESEKIQYREILKKLIANINNS